MAKVIVEGAGALRERLADFETDARKMLRDIDSLPASPEACFNASFLASAPDWIKTGAVPSFDEFAGQGFSQGYFSFGVQWHMLNRARPYFVEKYGFCVPCDEAISAVHALGPILEIGAGTGYWSAILAARGADIVATDPQAHGHAGSYGFYVASHFPAMKRMRGRAAVLAHPGRHVLCVWPTLRSPWARHAVMAMEPGAVLALAGEGPGGCTGDASLFRVLDDHFVPLEAIAIPRFPGMHDILALWRKA